MQSVTPQDQWIVQKEKVLAWLRVGFAVVAVGVIQLNPSSVARYPTLSYLSLGSFLLYSLVILYLILQKKADSRKVGIATTCLDLMWVSVIVFSTGGSRTPFFVYYLFPVITSSSRYGIKGGLLVALIGVGLYGYIRFAFVWANPLGLDTFTVRSIYLFVLAYIFGYLSEFEKKQNQKLLTLYGTAGKAALEQERRRIARELHDRLIQVLASLTIRLEACRSHLMESPKELIQELEVMEEATRSSIKEIRRFLAGKDTQIVVPGTLLETLREEIGFLHNGLGMNVVLESEPEELNLPNEVEQEIYLILREGLLNIAQHSQATRASILLKVAGAEIQGSLEDDGIGFDFGKVKQTKNGYGMTSMEESIRKIGGRLSVDSATGKGTRISFYAPVALFDTEPLTAAL